MDQHFRTSGLLIHRTGGSRSPLRSLFFFISFSLLAASFLFSGRSGNSVLQFTDISDKFIPSTGFGTHGLFLCDISGDQLPDLYVTRYFSMPISDLLYVSRSGRLELESIARRCSDTNGGSHGACWADLDNDGDYDLLNGRNERSEGDSADHNSIYLNDGNGFFTDVTSRVSPMLDYVFPTRSILAFDCDGDWDLDILAINGVDGSLDPEGEINEFYVQQGPLAFELETGGDLGSASAGQGATDTDLDGDGDIDIIAANRTGDVNFLVNDGAGHFTLRLAGFVLDEVKRAGDGITMGDVNQDGMNDMLFVSEGPPSEASLYLQHEPGKYVLSQSWSGVNGYMGGFADLDLDGDLDLVFAGDTLCWMNEGGIFTSGVNIPASAVQDPRTVAFADLDGDGDLDFSFSDKWGDARLIRNDLATGNHWLKVRLASNAGQAGAFGAKVVVYPEDSLYGRVIGFREARASEGYLAQNEPVLHFGLGDRTRVDVAVFFLDGSVAVHRGVAADRILAVSGAARFSFQVKVWLEGPYDPQINRMSAHLSGGGLLPEVSPYPEDPARARIRPGMTDWILLELKKSAGGPQVLAKSVFVREDGWLADPNTGFVRIPLACDPGDYDVVLRHRNHLAARSAGTVSVGVGNRAILDLTRGPFPGAKVMPDGAWAMTGGNADASDQAIFASDLAEIARWMAASPQYHGSDVTLDRVVDASDFRLCRNNMLAGAYSKEEP